MRPVHRFLIAFVGLLLITLVGTVGYMLVEGLRPLNALYMTVITMSTVGYGEVRPLTGAGKAFTIGLIFTMVGFALFFIGMMSQIIEGRIEDFLRGSGMESKISRLRDHVIVCGLGRFGRVVVDELVEHEVPIAIIEMDPTRQAELDHSGQPYVLGSALSEDVLARAGIDHARAIVIGTGSDADNVFITLSVRERNPRTRIHARGESDAAIRRLRLAGAHQVISAYHMGGQRMAASILRPAVVDFLEIARPLSGECVDLEEVSVHAESALVGRTVSWLEANTPRVRVVALKRGDEPIELIPDEATEIERGDHLVVIGESCSLAELARRATA